MKRFAAVATGAVLLAMSAAGTASAAFTVGGENGWQLSTDGIVDVFAVYQNANARPGGDRFFSFLNNDQSQYQSSTVEVGLLPSVIAFNVKAPTINGIESSVRVGIYPSISNASTGNQNRFSTNPNVDIREFFYTAKGKYGELLAGRALNLYQGKSILADMTLLTAGVVNRPGTTTTLGHIGYGYLYTNFGSQIRYTTPDFGGVKVAFSVGEPYNIDQWTAKKNVPRFETEISYATTLGSGISLQAYASGLYQNATRSTVIGVPSAGTNEHSLGGDAGVTVGYKGFEFHASSYVGEGLGVISAQDGNEFGSSSVDGAGNDRTQFGFLVQATYQMNPDWKFGVNYGQTRQIGSQYDSRQHMLLGTGAFIPMFKQEAVDVMAVYNLTKFIQFVAEYCYAQNTWNDSATQHSNSFALGTMFYW